MNNMQDTPIINNLEKKAVVDGGEWIRSLPSELVGLIPDSVWGSLSLDQKKEILRQNGILDKYAAPQNTQEVSQAPTPEVVTQVPTMVEDVVTEAPIVEQAPSVTKESAEFATLVEGVKNSEENAEIESNKVDSTTLTAEEKARVEEETASNANTQTFRLFGYQVDDDLTNNAQDISNNGDISDGKTWAATLLKKIFAIFGE